MSTTQAVCPQSETLRQFLQGRLPEAEAEGIEQHLAECSSCGDTLESLEAGDTLHELVRAAREPLGEERVVDGLVARLRELPPPTEQPDHSAVTASQSAALDPPEGALGPSGIRDERAQGIVRLLRVPQAEGELGRLGPYRVLSFLGAGGMGVVFRAQDEQLRRATALKVLRPSLGAGAHERFVQEARSAAAISHDHVVTIYQVGEDNGLAYLAMQLLEGETLEDRLKREGKLPPAEVLRIGRQIALGLAAAHAKHLIHRDVKPANIWLDAGTGRAKLLDFGLARALENDPRITESGMIAGTPSYMSPEQAKGADLDERSDLFSLGCVLYRASTGESPFPGTNALATLRAIEEDDPRPPQEVEPAVPPAVSDLVVSLLAKDSQRRPESAATVAETIERIEQGLPVALRAAPVTLSKAKGRNRGSGRAPGFFAALRMTKIRPRWVAAVAITIALAGIAYAAGPQIIRIATNRGQLVIETDDPNVTIEVQGEEARVIDLRTGRKLDLKAGVYEIKLTDGAEGLTLSTDKFTLTRGGKVIVQVRHEPTGTTAAGTGKVDQAKTDEPTFDTKTFPQWLVILETERKPERLAEGVRALSSLATKETTDLAIRKILELMREWGSRYEDNSPRGHLLEAAKVALWSMPAASVVPAILTEIKQGNSSSREFMMFMIYPAELPGIYDPTRLEDVSRSFRREHRKHANSFVSSVLELSRDDSSRTRDWAVEFLVAWCDYYEIEAAKTADVQKRLQEALSGKEPYQVFLVARFLAKIAPDSPGLSAALAKLLEDPGYQTMALEPLGQLGARAAAATPTLVKMLRAVLKDGYYVKRPADSSFFGPRPAGSSLVSLPLVTQLVKTIGSIGPEAREALPLLEELARNPVFVGSKTPELREPANEAIAKIKAASPKKPDGEPKKPSPKGDPKTSATHVPDRLYDGKTLQEWLAFVEIEQKPEKLTEAVKALGALATEESAPQAARTVCRLLRTQGSEVIDSSPRGNLIEAAITALWRMPAAAVVPALSDEIEHGNSKSRWPLITMLVWYTGEYGTSEWSERVATLKRELLKHGERIASRVLAVSRGESEPAREWATTFAATFCHVSGFDPQKADGLVALIGKQLASKYQARQLQAARVLVRAAPDLPELVPALIQVFSSTNNQPDVHEALQLLGDLGQRAQSAVPMLIKALDSLTTSGNYPTSTAKPTYSGWAELPQKVIETLGDIGPSAKEALPLLEEMAEDRTAKPAPGVSRTRRQQWTPELRQPAQAAIAKIKAAGKKAAQ